MATANELLSEVTGGIVALTIDSDLRTINIPKTITNIGVESDEDVLRLPFIMPRYYCNIDLSEFLVRINYENAINQGDVFEADDVEVHDDHITFSWLVSRHATEHRGDVDFSVCLRKLAEDGKILKEFNTTIATLPTLPGLETSEGAVNDSYDVVVTTAREISDYVLREAQTSGNYDGATFVPDISDDGVLSFTNNRGLENPDPYDFRRHIHELAGWTALTTAESHIDFYDNRWYKVLGDATLIYRFYEETTEQWGDSTDINVWYSCVVAADESGYATFRVVECLVDGVRFGGLATIETLSGEKLYIPFSFIEGTEYRIVKAHVRCVPYGENKLYYRSDSIEMLSPILGVDYFTPEDKNEIVEDVVEATNGVYSNAVTGTAKSQVVRIDDISPNTHPIKCQVHGKNLWNINRTENIGAFYMIMSIDENMVTIAPRETVYGIMNKHIPLKVGRTYTFSCNPSDYKTTGYGWRIKYKDGTYSTPSDSTVHTIIIEKEVEYVGFYLGFPYDGNKEVTIDSIQAEESSEATSWEPYLDPSTIGVFGHSKNLFGLSKSLTKEQYGLTISYDPETGTFTINGTPTTLGNSIYLDDMLRFNLGVGTNYTLSLEYVSGSLSSEVNTNVFYLGAHDQNGNSFANWLAAKFVGSGKQSVTKAADKNFLVRSWIYIGPYEDNAVTFNNYRFKVQLEVGDTATNYEHFINPVSITPDESGFVTVNSVYPTTTLTSDHEGVVIECEYNRNINKVIDEMKKLIASSGGSGNTSLIDTATGDMYALSITNGKLYLNKIGV